MERDPKCDREGATCRAHAAYRDRCQQAFALNLVGEWCQTTSVDCQQSRETLRGRRETERKTNATSSLCFSWNAVESIKERCCGEHSYGKTQTWRCRWLHSTSSTCERGKERSGRTERKNVKNMFSLSPFLFCCECLFHYIHLFPSALLAPGFLLALFSFWNISSFLFFLVLLLLLHLSCFPMLSLPGCLSLPLSAPGKLCQR